MARIDHRLVNHRQEPFHPLTGHPVIIFLPADHPHDRDHLGMVLAAKLGAEDTLFAISSVRLLEEIGTKEAIPYLKQISQNHHNQFVRRQARMVISRLRKRARAKP